MPNEPNWLEFFQDRERRHADFYLAFAQKHARRDAVAYEQLEAESGNLFKIAAWLAGQNDYEGTLNLATALWQESDFMNVRGFLPQGLPLLEKAHQATQQLGDLRAECIWLEALAHLHLRIGRPTAAQPLFEQALLLAQNLDDILLKARCQLHLGRLRIELGQLNEAISWFRQALQNYRQAQDYEGEIETLIAAGNLMSLQGEADKAVAYIEQGFPLVRTRQDQHNEVALRFALGYVGTATKDWQMAIAHYKPVVELARSIGDQFLEIRAMTNLGEAWLELGDIHLAVNILEEALIRQETIDDAITKAFTCLYLGKTYYALQRWHDSLIQLNQTHVFRNIPVQAPSATEAAWLIAENHMKLGHIDLARTALHDVLSLAPDTMSDIRQQAEGLLKVIEERSPKPIKINDGCQVIEI